MKDHKLLPPSTNRGVENTCREGLRACVDWLQVTFKNVNRLQDITDLLGLNMQDFIEFDTGKYGFDSHIRFGHIAIYYFSVPRVHNYYHLEITGQGCREFEQFSKYDWITLLGLICMLNVNITRFDIAIDDFAGYFTLNQVISKVKRGHVRSRFKKAKRIEEYDLTDGTSTGTTVYFGRPSSDIQIRFYDKYKERISAGYEVDKDVTSWIRSEIQMRDKRAMTAVYELINNINDCGKLAKGILANYISFCVASKDTNKSRWDTCKWWDDFLDGVEKIKLTQVAPDKTVEQVRDWFERSISANFALLLAAYDEVSLLEDFIIEGRSKLKKKHLSMLNRFEREKGIINGYKDNDRKKLRQMLKGLIKEKESSRLEDSDFD